MTTTEQHLTDGEVIGVVDTQLDGDAGTRVAAHLADCELCTTRIERQRHRQARLSALLRDTDFAVPAATLPDVKVTDISAARHRRARQPVRVTPRWLRIAAAIALLLGATLMIPPVQAAVVNWLREQWSRLVTDETTSTEQDAPQSVERGTQIEFVSGASEFTIEIAAVQSSGLLTVRRSATTVGRADTDEAGIELLSLPAGVRIVNPAMAAANYEVVVPATAAGITITIGGRNVARLSAAQLTEAHTMPVR